MDFIIRFVPERAENVTHLRHQTLTVILFSKICVKIQFYTFKTSKLIIAHASLGFKRAVTETLLNIKARQQRFYVVCS